MATTTTPPSTPEYRIQVREFLGRRVESEDAYSRLSPESQAALRQFSFERLLGYGLAYADATELRARVLEGETWQAAATTLAHTALGFAKGGPGSTSQTKVPYLRRAAALLRMSQMMMLHDTAERRAIFANAADLYEQAAKLTGDRQRVLINTPSRPLAGWLVPAVGDACACAIVIGGVEGWAMDFDSLGEALASRGIDTLLLDGPGQGESRFTHHHYLSGDWPRSYRSAIDFMASRPAGARIGFIGNSMGGSFAMAVASMDPRISACCNNGGVLKPEWARERASFFAKMVLACGTDDEEVALTVWRSVAPVAPAVDGGYPLLVVQGGKDPMVPTRASEMLLAAAPTTDKEMVVFSDGDHCIYNHRDDRDVLIADWTRARLTQQETRQVKTR